MKIIIIIFIIANITFGQTINSFKQEQLQKLDSIAVQDVPQNAPGIAVGIVKDGKIVYKKYAGYANLKDSQLINESSRFNIASNGKQFTALAILVLARDKKLNLKDDIRKFFPKFYPNISEKITIENLLNHTSGVRDVYDLWSLQGITWWKNSFDNQDVIKLVQEQKELNFKPGTKYLYSNTNYMLLAEIVGKVSGKSFVAFTKELFKKLNMPETSFENDHTKIRGQIAKAYFNFGTWTDYEWIWNVHGDGNNFSTLADQLEWEKIVQTKSNRFLGKDLIEKSQKLTQNSIIKSYGYGLEFGDYKGFSYKFHEGATGAWKATTVRFPSQNISIVTLTNTGKAIPSMQTRQMADVVLGIENTKETFLTKPQAVGSFVSVEDILGIYQNENDFTFQFEKRNDELFLIRFGRNDIKILRESGNVFHQSNDPDFKQEFKRNAKGEMEVTAYYTSHAPYTLRKLNVDWSNFDYKKLEGNFINEETKVVLKFKYLKDKDFEVSYSNKTNKALLISPTKLVMGNYTLEFENNEILLNSDRIRKVRFKRFNQ